MNGNVRAEVEGTAILQVIDKALYTDRQYMRVMRRLQSNEALAKEARGHQRIGIPYVSISFPDVGSVMPLLRCKKLFLLPMLRELLWFLSGDTTIDYLKRCNVHIWDSWVIPGTERWVPLSWNERMHIVEKRGLLESFKAHCGEGEDADEAAAIWMTYNDIPERRLIGGDLGPVYGAQWRKQRDVQTFFTGSASPYHERDSKRYAELLAKGYVRLGDMPAGESGYDTVVLAGYIDQLGDALDLLERDPGSSRMVVSSWNPSQLPEMALPPCHCMFQFVVGKHPNAHLSRESDNTPHLNLDVVQRSCDWPIGISFNWSSYATMLKIVGAVTDFAVGGLNYTMHDVHYYSNQNDEGQLRKLDAQFDALHREVHDSHAMADTVEEAMKWLPNLHINVPEHLKEMWSREKFSYKQKLDMFIGAVKDLPDAELLKVFEYTYEDAQPHIAFPVSK